MNPSGQVWRLRSAEWLLILYFGYVAAIAPRFPLQQQMIWRPFLVGPLERNRAAAVTGERLLPVGRSSSSATGACIS